MAGFNGIEKYYQFIWSVSIINENPEIEEQELIEELLSQIAYLQAEIAKLQAKIAALSPVATCSNFNENLYYSLSDSDEVRCLQEFLKNQGSEIYPEGLGTGNFGSLTLAAVIRFQEKYKAEILTPIGLEKGTGYFGLLTRQKANELIHK